MDTFPSQLIPSRISEFPTLYRDYQMKQWRARIFEFMVHPTKGGLDLRSQTDEKGQYSYCPVDVPMIHLLQTELCALGWDTRLAFGNTTLFIYDPKHIPEEVTTLLPEGELIDSE